MVANDTDIAPPRRRTGSATRSPSTPARAVKMSIDADELDNRRGRARPERKRRRWTPIPAKRLPRR
jgi:hypothetical protein